MFPRIPTGIINYRGAWQANTPYAVNDQVTEGGNVYVCTTAHTSGATFSGADWTNLTADLASLSNTQNVYVPGSSSSSMPQTFRGRNGGFDFGVDVAAAVPYRDFYLGRNEYDTAGSVSAPQTASGDDYDALYMSMNSASTTTTSSLSAGATSVPLSAALVTDYPSAPTTNLVLIGDMFNGNQEVLSVSGGSGTTTLTTSACKYAHPSGDRVTVVWDWGHEPTFELARASTDTDNPNWRLTIRSTGVQGGSSPQPNLGQLRLQTPGKIYQNADLFRVDDWTNGQLSSFPWRIRNDYSTAIETVPTSWSETNGSTTSGSQTVQLSSVTASADMLGCYITGTDIPAGAWVSGYNATNNTITISVAASGTGSALSFTIFRDRFQIRLDSSSSYTPMFSVIPSGGSHQKGVVLRGQVALGDSSTLQLPTADLDIYGSQINLSNGTGYGILNIISQNSPAQQVQLQHNGSAKITMAAGNKLGFYSAAAVTQPTAGGVTAGYTAGTSTAVTIDGKFTGNTGTSAYTVGDLVAALKNLGLIAA